MKVCLLSKDLSLYRACREALLPLEECHWDFGALPAWQPGLVADLWIWDCDAEEELPPESCLEAERIIFIVDRRKTVRFRDLPPVEGARILLKPVRPRLLQEFLQQMLAQAGTLAGKSDDPARRLERDVLLQHLLEANLSLQEFEQDRTGFLARTAHEFRAPLSGISGYCGLLLDRQLGPLNPEQLTALEKMQRSAKRLTRLANAMLQISMGRELDFEPTMQLGDMQELIEQAIGEVRPVADSKRLKLLADVTPPPAPLLFEPSQIEQVLVNLLDNACRLTPRGGSIDVKAFPTFWEWRSAHVTEVPSGQERRSTDIQRPNAYRVEVHDTGPGLRNGAPEREFEEPASSDHNRSSRAGLGLAICNQIISAHKGRVLADFRPGGATFSFVLPFTQKKANRAVSVLHKVRAAYAGK